MEKDRIYIIAHPADQEACDLSAPGMPVVPTGRRKNLVWVTALRLFGFGYITTLVAGMLSICIPKDLVPESWKYDLFNPINWVAYHLVTGILWTINVLYHIGVYSIFPALLLGILGFVVRVPMKPKMDRGEARRLRKIKAMMACGRIRKVNSEIVAGYLAEAAAHGYHLSPEPIGPGVPGSGPIILAVRRSIIATGEPTWVRSTRKRKFPDWMNPQRVFALYYGIIRMLDAEVELLSLPLTEAQRDLVIADLRDWGAQLFWWEMAIMAIHESDAAIEAAVLEELFEQVLSMVPKAGDVINPVLQPD